MKRFNTPILFLIFNRPSVTSRVFQEIKKIQPATLYVASDGPRKSKPGESEICDFTRKLVLENISWECDVKCLFRDENLGCKSAVSSAINWFFENEERGIILEDDCLPEPSFFHFCEELLEKFKEEPGVLHIGGTNFLDGKVIIKDSYYFSRMTHVWGWATWRRAWKQYDIEMVDLDELLNNFEDISNDIKTKEYWSTIFRKVKNNKIDTWDYQWFYSVLVNKGKTISPCVNMISNIGFGTGATHTVNEREPAANMPTSPIATIVHPADTSINYEADNYEMRKLLVKQAVIKTEVQRVVNFIKRLFSKMFS